MMKGTFVILSLLIILLVSLHESERAEAKGWVRRVVRVVCRKRCHTVCSHGFCTRVCYNVCGKKKRELGGASFDTEELSDDPQIGGAFPSALSKYDKDKDGKISRDEFSQVVVSSTRADQGTKEAFVLIDRNGDKYIDCKEFLVAPLQFAQKPTC